MRVVQNLLLCTNFEWEFKKKMAILSLHVHKTFVAFAVRIVMLLSSCRHTKPYTIRHRHYAKSQQKQQVIKGG